MKIEFSRQFWENPQVSNFMKIHPSSGSRIVPYGQTDGLTDRHDEANGCFTEFCKKA
jgi:hypothetical protein